MNRQIEEYLKALKAELSGSDSATIRDAVADAEDHLNTALSASGENDPDRNEAEALSVIIEQYGTPEETAAAYREVERRTGSGLGTKPGKKDQSLLGRFFGIYADPRAWGSLFYMLISFVTGLAYFVWATVGLSLSVSMALFIFGLPLALLFLLSVRGVSWLEGRLVEALLGVRMPRRRMFSSESGKLLDRIKNLLSDKHTWLSLLYMVIQFVLGTVYFCVLVTIFAFCATGILIPILQEIFHLPAVQFGIEGLQYFVPSWGYPVLASAGFLLWTVTMHVVKTIGGLHGRYAKSLLVTD